MQLRTFTYVLLLAGLAGCTKNATNSTAGTQTVPRAATFANGSDVSWVTQMEASGYKFYNNSGVQQDLFTILAGKGINAIRLRVWVNPSG
jgi:arabinogalactan endo-1,4-beta-galactosidase